MNRLKKFPHAKIDEQLEKRRDIPEYRDLLMDCKVSSDEIGVVLDTSHPSWKKLQLIVKQYEQKKATQPMSSPPPLNGHNTPPTGEGTTQQQQVKTAPRFQPLIFPKCELSIITSLCIELFELNEGFSGSIFQNGFTPETLAGQSNMFSPLTSIPPHLRLKQHISIPSIRRICFHNGMSCIPNSLRALIWAILLEVDIHKIIQTHQDREKNPPVDDEEDNYPPVQGLSVIKVDIHRTYPQIELFASAPVQKVLEKQLSRFCRISGLDYKQGMNYLLATLILVCMPLFSQLSIQDLDQSHDPATTPAGPAGVVSQSTPTTTVPESSMSSTATTPNGEGHPSTKKALTPSEIHEIRQLEAERAVSNCEETARILDIHCDFIIQCLLNLVTKLLPNTYSDSDFGSLQCLFMFFRLLLQYHDPVLSNYVDQYEMTPEFYASPWFLTLHVTRTKDVSIIILLWDSLFLSLREDPMLHYFVSLALLIDNRESLLQEQDTTLPEALSKMCITTPSHLSRLLAFSNVLRNTTPPSASRLLHTISTRRIGGTGEELAILSRMLCIEVGADEALSQTLNSHRYSYRELINSLEQTSGSTLHQQSIPFLFIDSRTQWDYMRGHLSASINFPLSHLQKEHARHQLLRTIAGFTTMHICVIGDGIPGSSGQGQKDVTALTSFLISNGVRYVSVVANGFIQIHRTASILGVDLVHHNPDQCPLCQNPKKYEQILQQQQMHQELQIQKYAQAYREDVETSHSPPDVQNTPKLKPSSSSSSQKNVSLEGNGSGAIMGSPNDPTTTTTTHDSGDKAPQSKVSSHITTALTSTGTTTGVNGSLELHPHRQHHHSTPSSSSMDDGSYTPLSTPSRGLFSSITKLFSYPPVSPPNSSNVGGPLPLTSGASGSSKPIFTPETSPLEYDSQQQQLIESQHRSKTTSHTMNVTYPPGSDPQQQQIPRSIVPPGGGDEGKVSSQPKDGHQTAIKRMLPTLSTVPHTLFVSVLLSNLRDITITGQHLRHAINLAFPMLINIALDAYQPSFSVYGNTDLTGHEYKFAPDLHPPQMTHATGQPSRQTVSSELWTSGRITISTSASASTQTAALSSSNSSTTDTPHPQVNDQVKPSTTTATLLQAQLTVVGVVPFLKLISTTGEGAAVTVVDTDPNSPRLIAANEESHVQPPTPPPAANPLPKNGTQTPPLSAHQIMSSILHPIRSMYDFLLVNTGVIEITSLEIPTPDDRTLRASIIELPSGYQTHYIMLFIPVLTETTAVWVLEAINLLTRNGVERDHIAVLSFASTYQGAKHIYLTHANHINIISLSLDNSTSTSTLPYKPISTSGKYPFHPQDEYSDVFPGISQLFSRLVR